MDAGREWEVTNGILGEVGRRDSEYGGRVESCDREKASLAGRVMGVGCSFVAEVRAWYT